MGKLTRKNLMVDADKVRDLAQRRGTSESEAVREAVDHALAAEEIMGAIRELHERHAFDHIDIKAWWPDDDELIDEDAIKTITEEDA